MGPEVILGIYKYQYQVYTCLIPVPIPGSYLPYTRQKIALDLNSPVLDWYESFFKSAPHQYLPGMRKRKQKTPDTRTSLVCSKVHTCTRLVYTSLTPKLIPGLYLPYIPGQNEPWMQYQYRTGMKVVKKYLMPGPVCYVQKWIPVQDCTMP